MPRRREAKGGEAKRGQPSRRDGQGGKSTLYRKALMIKLFNVDLLVRRVGLGLVGPVREGERDQEPLATRSLEVKSEWRWRKNASTPRFFSCTGWLIANLYRAHLRREGGGIGGDRKEGGGTPLLPAAPDRTSEKVIALQSRQPSQCEYAFPKPSAKQKDEGCTGVHAYCPAY